MKSLDTDIQHTVQQLLPLLVARGQHLVTAESLSGGQLAAAIVSVPGASAVFLGGVIVYASELKASLLGVSAELLAEHGPVHPMVAEEMAVGALRVLAVDRAPHTIALATTGVAGPDSQGGQPPGTVFVGMASDAGSRVQAFNFAGDRAEIQQQAVLAALKMALEHV
ncbi:MAG: CinA family protein [Microbacteriaceae bacterium]